MSPPITPFGCPRLAGGCVIGSPGQGTDRKGSRCTLESQRWRAVQARRLELRPREGPDAAADLADQQDQTLESVSRLKARHEVNLVGTFEVVGSDVRGGDPTAARFLRLSGGGDLGAVFRDTEIFGAVDGYLGTIAGIYKRYWPGSFALRITRDYPRLPGI
jgi:hypothetical protein